jgi:transcription antitermination factor NusG
MPSLITDQTMHGVFGANRKLQVDRDQTIKEGYAWYGILVRPRTEEWVCKVLRAQNEKPYWPRYRGPKRFGKKSDDWIWRGVVPGYLFLPIAEGRVINCPKIEACSGVRGFMRTVEGLAVLTLYDMRRIREIEEALNDSQIAAVQGIPFKVGQQVTIGGNPAWEGLIVRIENKRRIVVEIFMLGRSVCLTVSANKLETATRAAA